MAISLYTSSNSFEIDIKIVKTFFELMNMPNKVNDIKSPMIAIIKYWIIRIKVALSFGK